MCRYRRAGRDVELTLPRRPTATLRRIAAAVLHCSSWSSAIMTARYRNPLNPLVRLRDGVSLLER